MPDEDIKKLEKQSDIATAGKVGRTPAGFINTITGESLKSVTAPQFKIPTPSAPVSTQGIDITLPELKLTKEEGEESALSKSIREINERLVGAGAFKRAEEERAGVPVLRKEQEDITARIRAIQAEEKAVPLQIQQEFAGRGVTAGGVAPIQTARLRELGIKALINSAALEATKGNLTTALDQVDRAVATKFDSIIEERNIKIANLELLQKSPEATLADKNRAQRQIQIQENLKKQEQAEKDKQEEIWKVGVKYADEARKTGTFKSIVSDQIAKAQTKEEALRIMGENLPKEEKIPTDIETFKSFFPNVNVATPAGRQQYLDWKAQVSAAERKPE